MAGLHRFFSSYMSEFILFKLWLLAKCFDFKSPSFRRLIFVDQLYNLIKSTSLSLIKH
uniref:Uncharacterized protein n=1 Tax=Arundo donax TaxID=35708 RepID=A0A0A9CUC5_ARUDO